MVVENKDASFGAIWESARTVLFMLNIPYWGNRYSKGPHYWHALLQNDFKLHPVVDRIVNELQVRPVNWQQLLLEWPHVSVDDQTQLAYTRDEKAGADYAENGSKRQTKTSVGKYLARHWPHVPDHTRRDWAALHTVDTMEIVEGIENIICAVEEGPQSCMVSRYGSIPFDADDNRIMLAWMEDRENNDEPAWERHPYSVYTPNYGWQLAVHRSCDKRVLGRALCWTNPDDSSEKHFVRSYIRGEADIDRSETDTALEAWLRVQGFSKVVCWPDGAKFAKLEHPSEESVMMPYLDGQHGDHRMVSIEGGYVVMDRDEGEYCCDQTDGLMTYEERDESIGTCEDCNDDIMPDDDYTSAGRDEDTMVCGSCLRSNWSWVRGEGSGYRQSYREYYVPDDSAEQVNGQCYSVDTDNLPEDVVCLENGEYAERDACVDIDDEYYEVVDYRLVRVEEEHPDTGIRLALKDDCWEDHEGNWHRDDIERVELDGLVYTHEKANALLAEGQMELELETETEGELK